MAMAKKAEFLSNKPLGEDLFVPMVASEQSSSAVANSQKKYAKQPNENAPNNQTKIRQITK